MLDEFGLVVCGWSGEWDTAPRAAVLRAPNRRYRTFWAAYKGRIVDDARQLIDHRAATVVPIDDAGRFFVAVNDKIAALEASRRPHQPASRSPSLA